MKDTVIVYWASEDGINQKQDADWSILFEEPISLMETLLKNTKEGGHTKFFQCPSVKNFISNIFVFNNPIRSSYGIDGLGNISIKSKNHISYSVNHQPTLKNSFLFSYDLSFYFFSEEDIDINFTSPFFSKANHLQQGALVPGSMNIGSWFRPLNLEFNLWEDTYEFTIEEGEPIVYFNFNSEKQVILKRFKMNETLNKIAKTCSTASQWETGVPLLKRYKRFKNSKINNVVLKEIKENLIDE